MHKLNMIRKHFVDNIFKRAWVHIFMHTVEWFQVFLSNTNSTEIIYGVVN